MFQAKSIIDKWLLIIRRELPLTRCGSVTCRVIICDAKHNKSNAYCWVFSLGEKECQGKTAENFGVEKKRGMGRIETVVPVVWETIEYEVSGKDNVCPKVMMLKKM